MERIMLPVPGDFIIPILVSCGRASMVLLFKSCAVPVCTEICFLRQDGKIV